MSTPAAWKAVESLEPAPVWRLFAGIAAVPRPSKREERIRGHVKDLAGQNALRVREDRAGNLLIEVRASPGCEAAPITVLQGHLDMVCEKNAGTEHDFDNDPIRLLVDQDRADQKAFVRADGTTLGADNGIGVALALAAACSPEVVHGPLELLFTVDEEAGMSGAKSLSADFFRGRRMLNLDAEEDDTVYIGCSGGCDTNLTWVFEARPPVGEPEVCRVWVRGLCGGHSGADIHRNRGNAIKLLVRTLLGCGSRVQVADLQGGSLRNAIPREATAVVVGPAGTSAALERTAARVQEHAAGECAADLPAIQCERAARSEAPAVLSVEDSHRLLWALAALPHGVLGMHPSIDGLVETSNNVATVKSQFRPVDSSLEVKVATQSRSSSPSRIEVTLAQIEGVGRLAGATITTANEYPGWEPNPESELLACCKRVSERLFGVAPKVTAIHAGLECGIISERVPGMDMVSFGPRITGAHSPDERVYVESVQRAWDYLRAVLAELAAE